MNRSSTPDTIELELKLGLRDCDPLGVSDALYAVLGRTIPRHKDLLQNVYFDHEEYCIEPASQFARVR